MKPPCRISSTSTPLSEVLDLRRQLDDWRRTSGRRSRLPDELWELAAGLARVHGVSRVARTLRISYQKLRGIVRPAAPAGFMELPPMEIPGPADRPSVVEFDDGRGARMTFRLFGHEPLTALAEAFWRRGQ